MSAVDKAIWYIESHFREEVSLEILAEVAGVSRFHLSRIFCYSVGLPVSRYLRLRRLSEAASALAAGENNILDLALSLGYTSHEAFSRAFKQHFRQTPEQVRRNGHTRNLSLMEAKRMKQRAGKPLSEPRMQEADALRICGISRHYGFEQMAQITSQWQSFGLLIPSISREPSPTTYGVIYNSDDNGFDYLTGVLLTTDEQISAEMVQLVLAPQTYAVFKHQEHVSSVSATCAAIWSEWLPGSGKEAVQAPWFERYGKEFEPASGDGGLEIWIPVR